MKMKNKLTMLIILIMMLALVMGFVFCGPHGDNNSNTGDNTDSGDDGDDGDDDGPTHEITLLKDGEKIKPTDCTIDPWWNGAKAVKEGKEMTFKVSGDTGYTFREWTIEDSEGESETVTYVTDGDKSQIKVIADKDKTITAHFDRKEFTLNVHVKVNDADPTNEDYGSVQPTVGEHKVKYRETVNLNATPADGYHLVKWVVDRHIDGATPMDMIHENEVLGMEDPVIDVTAYFSNVDGDATFADWNFERLVRVDVGANTDIKPGEPGYVPLKLSQLENVSFAAAVTPWKEDEKVSNLHGIQQLGTALTRLPFGENKITDLSPLAGCNFPALWNIELDDNINGGKKIESVEGLRTLTNVTSIDLKNAAVSDISPLSGMTKLKMINFNGNQITDLSALLTIAEAQKTMSQNKRISSLDIENNGMTIDFNDPNDVNAKALKLIYENNKSALSGPGSIFKYGGTNTVKGSIE